MSGRDRKLETHHLEPLMRAEEVAELLNVKVSTVYEWARMGYIPCMRLGTGKKLCVRFERHAIRQWREAICTTGRISRIPRNGN